MSNPANPKPRMIIIKVIALVKTLFSLHKQVMLNPGQIANPVQLQDELAYSLMSLTSSRDLLSIYAGATMVAS
jgi:hypothetical protein